MMSFSESVFARSLRWLARAVCLHPVPLVYSQVLFLLLCIGFTALGLKIDTDRDDLIGARNKFHQAYVKFQKEFPGGDELAVVVQSGDLERNREFIERLARKIKAEPMLFTDVFYKGDLTTLGPKGMLLESTGDLEGMRRSLHDYGPFIKTFARASNLNSLFNLINRQFLFAPREGGGGTESLLSMIPFLRDIINQATRSILIPGTPPPPGVEALFGGGEQTEEQIYVTYDKGRIFLLSARARKGGLNGHAIEKMRQLIGETQLELPGVNVGLTGQPVLDYDEMHQSEHDSILASIVALILCSAIFIVAYRELGRPVKAAICLIFGLGYSMGFATLAVGHLNILSVTFAPMLIGLAIDFGVHFTTRYEEEQRKGRSPNESTNKAMVFTGQGIVTGAMTTASAFLAMALTHFKGIQEMGIISGGGLLLCLIPMMTLLPILLMREKRSRAKNHTFQPEKRVQLENMWLRRPWVVVVICLALCAGAALEIPRVHFDYDLLHMQSKGLASVAYEKILLDAAGKSLLYAAVIANSPQEAIEYAKKIKQLPSVANVESVADYFSGNQEKKLQLVKSIQKEVSDIHFASIDTGQVELHQLSATLWYLMGYLGLGAGEAAKTDPALAEQLRELRRAIAEFRVVLLSGQPQVQKQLQAFQQILFEDIHQTFAAIRNQDTSGPLRPEDLPPSLRDRFIGITGKYLLQVYPRKDIWQHQNQREFIDQLLTVVPEGKMSGSPIQLYEYTTLLKDSYEQAACYALIAIVIMVYLHFRSIVCVVLSLLPVAIGALWLWGFLGLTQISFNPANIMTLPLMIGIGVTNGIQILNRFAEEKNPAILAVSTGKAVLVSGLTAIAGFGSLILARHLGIRSLGIVMSVGIAGCMIAGLTFLPSVLMLLSKSGWTIPIKTR